MIGEAVAVVFGVYEVLIIARVILTWLPQAPRSGAVVWIEKATEPVLGPCRDMIASLFRFLGSDARNMPLDFSPILALTLVDLVRRAAFLAVRHLP